MTTITTLALVWGKAWPILAALLFFGLIIATHEAGHFLTAKLFRVRVNEFSIGMGPTLLKRQKGETQYSLRLLPIGGYVAMEGEDGDSDIDGAFGTKPPWQRAIIILAGATVNLLTGLLLMTILLGTSDLIGTPAISQFKEGAASQVQGLQEGDRIRSVNNHVVRTEYELSYFMSRDKDGVMDFVVERDGKKVPVKHVAFETEIVEGTQVVKYDFAIVGVEPGIGNVIKYAVLDSIAIVRIVVSSLWDLVTGQFSMSDMAGPVGTVQAVADTTSDAAKSGNLSRLLLIMALIAINVGAFNLIPFPALDGGRFVFIMLEGIFRRPISKEFQAAVNMVGMAMLLGLMVMVTFSDIGKLIS
ncbi:MAG: site-2 protease family protein [Clostridia bacterium]|nr:site-2 protease family protein [Clostridia bacterium]